MTSPNSSEPKPTLFGISNSNRIPADFWGKNRFNSSFPAALACWMRHKGLNPVYVHTSEGNIIASDEKISFDDVFNSKAPNEELRFDFESRFAEFQNYSHDSLDATFSDNQVPLILQPRLEDERKTPRSRGSGVRRFRLEQHGFLSAVPQLSRFPKKFGKVVRRSVGSCRYLLLCSRICECNPQPADLTFPSPNGPRRTAEYFPKCQT